MQHVDLLNDRDENSNLNEAPDVNPVKHTRTTLGKFISSEFNYGAFKQEIEASALTPQHKVLLCRVFDPASSPEKSIIRLARALGIKVKDMISMMNAGGNAALLESDSPLIPIWRSEWDGALKHYESEIESYKDEIIERQYKAATRNGRSVLGLNHVDTTYELAKEYPYEYPPVKLSKSNLINAGITLENGKPLLLVTEGFLNLSEEKQRAVLRHECYHAFEPVLAKQLPQEYWMKRLRNNFLTLNYVSRREEYNADALAGRLGDGLKLANALRDIEGEMLPHSILAASKYKELLPVFHLGVSTAHKHGFKFEYSKNAAATIKLSENDSFAKRTVKTFANAGVKLSELYANRKVGKWAETSPEEFEKKANQKRKPRIKLSTHPATDDRIKRLKEQSFRERIKKKPGSILGL